MTGMVALWNTSAVDAVTATSVSAFHSGIHVRRMTAGRACKWQVGFVVCVIPELRLVGIGGNGQRRQHATNTRTGKTVHMSISTRLVPFSFTSPWLFASYLMCKFAKHLNTNGSVDYWLPPPVFALLHSYGDVTYVDNHDVSGHQHLTRVISYGHVLVVYPATYCR